MYFIFGTPNLLSYPRSPVRVYPYIPLCAPIYPMCPAGLAPYGEPCRGLQVAMDLYPSLLSADAGIAGSSGFSELYSVRRRRMASATARWGAAEGKFLFKHFSHILARCETFPRRCFIGRRNNEHLSHLPPDPSLLSAGAKP